MNQKIASIISYIFHPLVITTYIFGILLYGFPQLIYTVKDEYSVQFLLIIFILTFILPALLSLILVKTEWVSSIEMESKEDRTLPFVFTITIYMMVTYIFYRTFKTDVYFSVILGFITLNMIIVAITTLWWKISAHASGVGGLLSFYIVSSFLNAQQYNLVLCLILIIIAGLTSSSRLALNSHNLTQVVAGFFLGLLTGVSSLIILTGI